jgi:hypothetical protein
VPNGGNLNEEEAIGSFWTDTIYPTEFSNRVGKYFNIVTEEDGSTSVEYEQPPHSNKPFMNWE